MKYQYQIEDENIIICFECESDKAHNHFFEFRDETNNENPPCPRCGRTDCTLPKYYLEEITVRGDSENAAQLFKEYGDICTFIPLIDLSFQNFTLPNEAEIIERLYDLFPEVRRQAK